MTRILLPCVRVWLALFAAIAFGSPVVRAADDASLTANSSLEADADHDSWPDEWPRGSSDCGWASEGGNHFLRLTSPRPGATVIYYREIAVPADVRALELRWKQRVVGLKRGKQPWFDARIMLEWLDAGREKLAGKLPTPARGKDTDGWEEKSVAFLVPEGATLLKFMPSLFQVEAGTFELDDVSLAPTDPAPLVAAAQADEEKRQADREKKLASLRAAARKSLDEHGSLIPRGDFQLADDKGAPQGWGKPGDGASYAEEESNRFLRLETADRSKTVMIFREIALPADARALEMTWKQRLSDFQRGELPWHDARFILKFVDVDGKHVGDAPAPATAKNSDGWIERRASFLVPEGAAKLQWMPCLFQAARGRFEIDDVALRPTDPTDLLAARAQREKEARERYVPPEEPRREKWPPIVRVRGNRLVDPRGNEVWLQGVNAGGLETLPNDDQVTKSVVVALDVWKANAVRLPMNERFWFGRDPVQKDGGESYRARIDQIVTLCANRGAYLILDLHRFRAPKEEHVEFWKDAAARYKDHPAVLFDLFNEPHGISWEVWRDGGDVGKKIGPDESAFLTEEEKKKNQHFHSPGMQALVDAVRSTGAKNVVIAGGLAWAGDLSGVAEGHALVDERGHGVMYSWHQYNWHKGWAKTVLPVAEKHPVLVGEVGADATKLDFIPAADQEDPFTWVPDMLGFIQTHRLNWTGWCLHPKASPVMISDWSYTPTPFWGEFAKRALAGEKFEMKRMR